MTDARVDAQRFPRVAAYLDRLPDGLVSYADCKAKASIYRTALQGCAVEIPSGALPRSLAQLFHRPVAAGLWVSAVLNNAAHLAIADALFDSDQAFVSHAYGANQRLFESRLYKILMWVASPAMVLRSAHSRWYTFHRGTELSIDSTSNTTAIVLQYPENLHDPLMLECFVVAFRAAAEAGGAKDVEFQIVDSCPTRSKFHGSWT